jgi:DNA modification methylase
MIPNNLAELVTFIPNKEEPIHNWFYYKEGYAKKLVEWLIEEFKLEEPILDPFCGVGTTMLAAKQLGLKSIGFDASPLAAFAAEAKTRNYKILELEKQLEEFSKLEPMQIGKFSNKQIRRLFREKNLDDIYFYYKKSNEITDSRARKLFLLALIDTTGRVANVIKIGGSLRKQKKPEMPVKKLLLGKIKKMLLDLKQAQKEGPEPEIFESDARITKLKENSVGCVITSPPYLNKIEYTSVYKMELGLFFNAQETKLRAHIADAPTGRDYESNLPLIAKAYFEDMEKAMKNIFFELKPSGKAVIIIGGGCFPYETVESDDEIIKIAEKLGFRLVQKIVARNIHCMRCRTIKVGTVRESIIVLEKPSAFEPKPF